MGTLPSGESQPPISSWQGELLEDMCMSVNACVVSGCVSSDSCVWGAHGTQEWSTHTRVGTHVPRLGCPVLSAWAPHGHRFAVARVWVPGPDAAGVKGAAPAADGRGCRRGKDSTLPSSEVTPAGGASLQPAAQNDISGAGLCRPGHGPQPGTSARDFLGAGVPRSLGSGVCLVVSRGQSWLPAESQSTAPEVSGASGTGRSSQSGERTFQWPEVCSGGVMSSYHGVGGQPRWGGPAASPLPRGGALPGTARPPELPPRDPEPLAENKQLHVWPALLAPHPSRGPVSMSHAGLGRG